MSANLLRSCVIVLALSVIAPTARAVDYSDPTWPCIQRKVEALSVGLMWPHPIPEAADTGAYARIVATLALRRLTEEEIAAEIDGYMIANPGTDRDALGLIFEGVFDQLSATRRKLISGIGRYSEKQIALAGKIDAEHAEMSALEATDEKDFDRMDELEAIIDWDERIYEDRAQALTYVCETPVLLEKRLYAIGQLLLAKVPD